jgi:hypothetical protein
MAGLLDLFSGRSSDIYGNGLLTPEQRGGLGNIGLLALAGKLGQLAGPSFSPVPDFGAALGQAAGAYGASQEGAGTAALNAILTGQKGRKLEQELEYSKQLGPVLSKLAGQWPGADGGTGGGEGSGSTGGGAAAPGGAGTLTPGGALTGNPGSLAMAESPEIQEAVAHKLATTSGIQHWASFNPKLYNALQSAGLPTSGPLTEAQWQQANPLIKQYESAGGQNIPNYRFDATHTAGGTHQITNSTWNSIGGPAIAASMRGAAAPTAAAPVGTGTSGLLTPTAPNPLSDAEPMLPARPAAARPQAAAGPQAAGADLLAAGMSPEMVARYLARPAPGAGAAAVAPNQVGRFAGIAPGTPVNSGGFPYNPEITDPAVAARVAQSMAAIKQAQQSGAPWYQSREGSGGGGPLAAPPGAGGDPIMSVTSADQAGGGDAPGAAAPRPPLPTMGPAGIELPPMQGPLAAPAPAAAAPAAPGPGLLSTPGMPAAAALPRVNPAFDAYARNLAVAAGLVKGAGLPDALSPLLEVFKGSPAYKAQQTIAEKSAAQPFEQAQTLFNKQVEIAGVGPIEAAKLPYALAQTYFKAEQDIRAAGPVAAAQNFERIRADNAAKGIITTKDADGNIKLSIDPDAVKAVSGATATIAGDTAGAQERARLQQQAGLQPGISGQTKYAETAATQDAAARQQAITARNTLPLLDDSRQQLAGAGIFSGPTANLDMTLAQLASIGGWPSDKLVNTQTYLQQAGVRAAAVLQSGAFGTGSGVSSNDLRAAERISAGDNTIDIRTIRRIMDLAERKAVRDIDTFNSIAQKRDPTSAIEHPTRWTGRTTGSGERIMRKPDGSLEVETR